jgi:hypothetical protein
MSKQIDSDRAAELYSAALRDISANTIGQSLKYFHSVSPSAILKDPDKYFDEWFEIVDEARQQAWNIGQAYYRLDTAIWTGTTPDDGTGELLTLKQLWIHFLKRIGTKKFRSSLPDSEISLTDSVWDDYDLDYSRRNAASTYYTRAAYRLKKFEDASRLRDFVDPDDYLRQLDKVMQTVTSDMARESQRLAHNGGRDAVLQGAQNTKAKRVGYLRVPRGLYTCGFCIMLASRGAVYNTKASAGLKGVGREYHAGCDCEVRAIYEGQALPAVNKKAEDAWKDFSRTKGGGASDFNKWWAEKTNE